MIRTILGDNTPIDLNSTITLTAAFYMGIVGPEVFIIQPGFIQGLVKYAGYGEREAGYVASAEMWGLATTAILMTYLANRLNWRHVFTGSLLIIIGGNLASLTVDTPFAFAAWRFTAGIGCGGLFSLSFAVIGLTDKPERNYGYLIMCILIYGAVGLLLMPAAYSLVGMEGVIIFFALFPVGGLFLVRYLPHSGEEHIQVEQDAVNLPWRFKGMALAAMLSYFLAQGVVWAYLFLIGTNGGGTEQQVANGLTLSQVVGIGGAFTAAMLGLSFGRAAPLTIGILGGFVPFAFLFGQMGIVVYSVAVCVANFAWNMTHPFLLASMASFDRTGRVVVYAVAFQMLGLAIGPAIAATVISEGEYSNVNWLGMLLAAVALFLILPAVIEQQRLART